MPDGNSREVLRHKTPVLPVLHRTEAMACCRSYVFVGSISDLGPVWLPRETIPIPGGSAKAFRDRDTPSLDVRSRTMIEIRQASPSHWHIARPCYRTPPDSLRRSVEWSDSPVVAVRCRQ